MSKNKNKHYKGSWSEPTGYNVHHRLPKSRGGADTEANRSTVPIAMHLHYNALFGSNPTAEEVALILSTIWIDPEFEIIVRRKCTQ